MPRLLFEKKGNAVWISHLDLMRVFQRAFKRADLPLTHTHGFNPRPSVSIALPLSVGIDSRCELLDFDLSGESVSCDEIRDRLNSTLVSGIRVREVYEEKRKLKDLALMMVEITLEFDGGVPEDGENVIRSVLAAPSLVVPKKSKSKGMIDQDIVPMIRKTRVWEKDPCSLCVEALICCQNPTLNPIQIVNAIQKYAPDLNFQFAKCSRLEIYDPDEQVFR